MSDRLLAQSEVCERLGIAPHQLLSLCRRGKIRFIKTQGSHCRRFYFESAIEALLAKRQRAAERVLLLMPTDKRRSA